MIIWSLTMCIVLYSHDLWESDMVDEAHPTPVTASVVAETTVTPSVDTETGSSPPETSPSWLITHQRPLTMLALVGVTCGLAVLGSKEAQLAVFTLLTTLAGATWGERSALKVPKSPDGG